MDPQTPNNLPVDQSDLSFQVMPQDGAHFEAPAPVSAPKPTVPLAPPLKIGPNGPLPPTPPVAATREMMPMDSEPPFWKSKIFYIVVGAVILIVLGLLAYVLLGSKSSSNQPVAQVTATKLPKVWLQQYFPQNLDANGNCNDQTICGDDADPDKDGLTNYEEFKAGTNPTNPDTGGSGIADGDAVHIYHTEPTLKYTDRRDIVAQNNWTDGYQIKNGYDPLTPGLKFTDIRKQQIADDTAKFHLHEPTITTLSAAPGTAPSPTPTPAPAGPQTNTPAAKSVTVMIENNQFNPATINISAGDTVVWLNKDLASHHVASNPHPTHTDLPGLESKDLTSGQTYSFKFVKAGTWGYHDHLNPNIKGAVVVK